MVPNYGWIVSPTYKMSHEIIEPYLGVRVDPGITPLFPPGYIEWNATEREGRLPNGSMIALRSCDQGALKFQGPKRRWVMFDEEPDEEIWWEVGARQIPGEKLDRWICMTPLQGMTWVWDNWVNSNPPLKGHAIFYASVDSNPAMKAAQVEETKERFERDPMREARLYGRFMSANSKPAFPTDAIQFWLEKIAELPQPRRGFVTSDLTFMEEANGPLEMWEAPQPGWRYVIGADVAEGLLGGAWSVGSVWRVPDCQQVAQYRAHIEPAPFGRVLARMGRYYNEAFIVPEANNHGHSTISALVADANYTNVYQRTPTDQDLKLDRSLLGQWGFLRSAQTAYDSDGLLYERARSGNWQPRSQIMLKEMLGAVRDSVGRVMGTAVNAQSRLVAGRGLNTDCIIAACMAMVGMRDERFQTFPSEPASYGTDSWEGFQRLLSDLSERRRVEELERSIEEEWR